jgi:Outer membrane cobalamin receptor protein
VISPSVIQNFNAQSTADLISNSGMVAMQKSQQGGGSPMLRGFEASRVLLVVDGVRLNNAIYRAGHLQNVITLDNNILDRAEILFGPSSTVYGSDALGGVIHFITRAPHLSKDSNLAFGGNAFVRYGTVNDEKTGHVDFNIGGQKLASLTSFTFSDFGDLRMGEKTNAALGEQFGVRNQYAERAADNLSDVLVQNSDPFVQKSSGYKQWDLLQKFMFQSSARLSHALNFQYSNSTNVPRYDRLTDPQGTGLRFGDWHYGPQKRILTSYQLKINALGKWADSFSGTISFKTLKRVVTTAGSITTIATSELKISRSTD